MTARNASGTRRQELITLLGPVVASAGYDLEDLLVSAAGRRSVIRVIVDSDTGIDLDAVADVARAVSEALDNDNGAGAAFASPYGCEVSSPGVDRPLTEPRHWRRAVGRLVRTTAAGSELRARIIAVDDDAVSLEQAADLRVVPWNQLGEGRIEVEFSRPGESVPEESDTFESDTAEEPGEPDAADDVLQEEV
jgi:ribosome maturation factor RimP